MKMAVPKALRTAFIVHFWVDLLFAVPLMIAPTGFLELFGWGQVDPFTARIVAAALLGIGTESLLGRDANVDHYRGMLRLKVIWSSAAVIGVGWSIVEQRFRGPFLAWTILAIFLGFNLLWVGWWKRLGSRPKPDRGSA